MSKSTEITDYNALQKTVRSPTGPFNKLIADFMVRRNMRRIEEFAAASGIGETTLYNIVMGKKTATGRPQKILVDTLAKLADTLHVPMHELLYMLEPDGYGRDQLADRPAAVRIKVQLAGMVGAGSTQQTESDRDIYIEEDFARGKDLVAFQVQGNSMEGGKNPIHDGDIVVVNRNDRGLIGNIVVARINDDGYVCKKPLIDGAGQLQQLVSTNLDYADPQFRIIDRENVAEIVGKVVRVIHDT